MADFTYNTIVHNDTYSTDLLVQFLPYPLGPQVFPAECYQGDQYLVLVEAHFHEYQGALDLKKKMQKCVFIYLC